ncbi:hypothetical protein LTH96_00925 [Nesterenkonia sp. LB17]|uniref:hypothetical protein n=1 Tax=Nesterenkonia sp. LB17 TaxID=2901230 RepID=UPI001F4CEFC8|nr:hypothetical protein [Nesterenkonia sp. LB17]MCH8564303.1 hypothetical protein [Nesterenkonia sp. LB17]
MRERSWAALACPEPPLPRAAPDRSSGPAQTEVVALWAEVLRMATGAQRFNVYADPAGHPSCLCRH